MPITIKSCTILIQVFDMSTSLHFYRDILGFKLISQSQPELGDDCGWAMLRLDDSELMLNTAFEPQDRPPFPDLVRLTHHDDTRIYFGCPDVDAAYDHLIAKGVSVKQPYVTGYGFKALDLADPDGYGLTFQWPIE
jgi:glyoxylase I family protein